MMNKKQTYEAPQIAVVAVDMTQCIAAGSETVETIAAPTSGNQIQNATWDGDEISM